jgi:DNA topoisomerase-6 subunit B
LDDRARAICTIIPLIAQKIGDIVELPPPNTALIEGKIMRQVVLKKRSEGDKISIKIDNYTMSDQEVSLYDISSDPATNATISPDFVIETDGEYTKVWKLTIPAGKNFEVAYTGKGGGIVDVQGIAENLKVVVDLDV